MHNDKSFTLDILELIGREGLRCTFYSLHEFFGLQTLTSNNYLPKKGKNGSENLPNYIDKLKECTESGQNERGFPFGNDKAKHDPMCEDTRPKRKFSTTDILAYFVLVKN